MNQNPGRDRLIERIHESDLQLSIALTGGGSGLISELLAIPGASQTVLDASVPYSKEALVQFLGRTPDSFCSPSTSQMMAVQAYFNSTKTHGSGITAIGCSAALASKTPKKGDHRFFKSIQTENSTSLIQVVLEKGKRSRIEEERLLVELGLSELAGLIGIHYEPFGLTQSDLHEKVVFEAQREWVDVFHGQSSLCCANKDLVDAPRGVGILAGSFNPLHAGHLEMAESFERRIGAPVHFELAIKNADKPPIDYLTIRNRVNQFSGRPVWLTRSATFVEKSRSFPGNNFIVGIDTILRIADPKYYSGKHGLVEAIREIKSNDCRFIVFGRFSGKGFKVLSDLDIDSELLEISEQVPEIDFRNDISSSQIRSQSSPGNWLNSI